MFAISSAAQRLLTRISGGFGAIVNLFIKKSSFEYEIISIWFEYAE